MNHQHDGSSDHESSRAADCQDDMGLRPPTGNCAGRAPGEAVDENLLARKVAEHVANLPAEANGTGKGAQVHGPAGARAVDDAPTMPLGRSLKDARDRAHQDGMVSGDSQAAGHDADDEGRRRRDR